MEKKHRDIVVDGQTYGWIVNFAGDTVTIYKDKKVYCTTSMRPSASNFYAITPSDVEIAIRDFNTNIKALELHETLSKEWTAFLDTIPWQGYGNSIEESNQVFVSKRKNWMKKMVKKHGVTMDVLNEKFNHDKTD